MVRCDDRIEDLFAGAIGSRSRTRSIEEQNAGRKRRNRLAPRQVKALYVPPWRCARPMEVARPTHGEEPVRARPPKHRKRRNRRREEGGRRRRTNATMHATECYH
eukprot:289173-Pyramimonas_sp.AAC.1